MNTDIVARLERLMCSEAGCGDMRIYMTAKLAAAEIQLLREENRELSGKTGELKREIDRINKSTGMGFAHNHRMMDQLRAERDEARQEICLLRASSTNATEKVSFEMIAYAASRGWDDLFADEGKHEQDA